MLKKYYTPNVPDTLWHVFDYNAGTEELIYSGKVGYHSDSSSVGGASVEYLDQEAFDIQLIMSDMVEKNNETMR